MSVEETERASKLKGCQRSICTCVPKRYAVSQCGTQARCGWVMQNKTRPFLVAYRDGYPRPRGNVKPDISLCRCVDASTPPNIARDNPSIVTLLTFSFFPAILRHPTFPLPQPIFAVHSLREWRSSKKTLEADVDNYSELARLN